MRCVAEEMRLRTFVRRPVDSVGVGDLSLLASLSEAPEDFEKRPDNRLLDFFLSPNMATPFMAARRLQSYTWSLFKTFGRFMGSQACVLRKVAPKKRLSATQGVMVNEL